MTKRLDSQNGFDCAVIGGGPAGLTAAIALCEAGARTALIARLAPYSDNRTTALLGGSHELLERLDVWRRCADKAAPLRVMRLIDDTHRLFHAPEIRFSSDEIKLETFGYNIENANLVAALEQRCAELPNLTRIDDEAATVTPHADAVEITTQGGRKLATPLVIGADGRRSLCRSAAGITVDSRALHQAAVTFNISHARPHHDTSTEFHTAHGPCVFVPLPGNRSSVVWVTTPAEAARMVEMSDAELAEIVERQMQSIYGRVTVAPGRHTFPLAIERPSRFAAHRIVLVGEAAHVLPPIGAQGLNLGLRDAADVAAIVSEALKAGEDPGSPRVLTKFESARRADITTRTWAVDMANRTLLGDFLPTQAFRAFGMHLLANVGPLRRIAMREGLQPSWRRSPPPPRHGPGR
ncbi:MAG TPA: UbiH/UbiF family hydroxylase [Xanthobacteraceae bacterium]|nr:UbiH/UbiF family hydroxylase [Xanthobacteraceae bacterium]